MIIKINIKIYYKNKIIKFNNFKKIIYYNKQIHKNFFINKFIYQF